MYSHERLRDIQELEGFIFSGIPPTTMCMDHMSREEWAAYERRIRRPEKENSDLSLGVIRVNQTTGEVSFPECEKHSQNT